MPKIKAHMICHTHWDREWYLTSEQFKTKLVRLVDTVLYAAENSPDYLSFMLDGQAIALEDYLEIRPQNIERLGEAVKLGKICIGPWYILPDEVLISGESHIRNYLIGQKVTSKFGSKMNIGYLPDSFGHPEQMPQILKGLSMDTIVFWRGTGNHMEHSEFYWQSPCEKYRIFSVHMPYGYGNCARLSENMEETVPRLKKMMEDLELRSTSNIVLLMNGSDHILNQTNIVEIVSKFNELVGEDTRIELSTLQAFLDELKPNLPDLETYKGELRYGDRSMLLGGTMSTRVYLKQYNTKVQRKMESYLEPIVSLQRILGIYNDFNGYQTYIWKKILENHPHDSICGCSIDEVHQEMMTRFKSVEQLEDTLMSDALTSLAEASRTQIECENAQLILFEPTQDGLPTYSEVTVDLDPMLVKRVNFGKSTIDEYEDLFVHPEIPKAVKVYDNNGRKIEARIFSAEKAYYMHLQDETAPEVYKVNRCKLALLLPAYLYGFSTLTIEKCEEENKNEKNISVEVLNTIENEFYKVTFDKADAAFTVVDKRNGKIHKGVGRLVDRGDAGDEYTYSWPEKDLECTMSNENIKVVCETVEGICQRMTVYGELLLPDALREDRSCRSSDFVGSPVEIVVSVYPSIDRIDFDVKVDNHSKDHILQVEIPSDVFAEKTWSSSAFAVTEHEIQRKMPESWMEYPFPTNATHGFVDINDGQNGVSLFSDGLTEYEGENRQGVSYLRLTLLRCVGWLSRADLLTRVGNGGWSIETPEAQCLGEQRFRFSIMYHTGTWQQANTFAAAQRFLNMPRLEQSTITNHRIDINTVDTAFISQLPSDVRLSALKLSEDGTGIVMRVYSISKESKTVSLKLPKLVARVESCNLAEEDRHDIKVQNSAITFDIDFGEIRTFLFH